MKKNTICKKVISSLLLIIIISICTTNVFAQNDEKPTNTNEITTDVTFTSDINTSPITDKNIATTMKINTQTQVKINSKTKMQAINIIFDALPQKWSVLQENGDEIPCGKFDAIHEYVSLDLPQNEIILQFEDAVICEIQVFDGKEILAGVQDWNAPYYNSDLLVLCEKADGKNNIFSGLFATYAGEDNRKVQVAYNEKVPTGEKYHELLNNLWKNGIHTYPVFAKEKSDVDYKIEILRRFKPNVVVTYGDKKSENYANFNNALTLAKNPNEDNYSALEYGIYTPQKVYFPASTGDDKTTIDFSKPLQNFFGKTAFDVADIKGDKKTLINEFSLDFTTVLVDVQKNDLFENIQFDENENAVAPPATVKPDDSVSSLPEKKETEKEETAPSANKKEEKSKVLGNSMIIVGILIATWAVSHKSRQAKRGASKRPNMATKPLTHNSMRDTKL